ncbi:MAG TPA: DNA sulfur modification protein DndE [Bacilli bacterium]
MKFQLKTSRFTADRLNELQTVTKITPNILARIAVSLSISKEILEPAEVSERNGRDFNRDTLTGEYDYMYKALIAQHLGREISDEEYFPELFNAHLERGVRILSNEYKYSRNIENFILNLVTNKQG